MSIPDQNPQLLVSQTNVKAEQQDLSWLTTDVLKQAQNTVLAETHTYRGTQLSFSDFDADYPQSPVTASIGQWEGGPLYNPLFPPVKREWTSNDALAFFAHLRLTNIQVSKDRNFSSAFWTHVCKRCRARSASFGFEPGKLGDCQDPECGTTHAKRVAVRNVGEYQYIKITEGRQFPAIVIDIDIEGTPGGGIQHLNEQVLDKLNKLAECDLVPYCVGVNPIKGTGQIFYLIDTVYVDEHGKPEKPLNLYNSLRAHLASYLAADKHCATSGFVRNPFYTGNASNAYTWHFFRGGQHQLKGIANALIKVGYPLPGRPRTAMPVTTQTGTDLINKAQANVRKTEELQYLWEDIENNLDIQLLLAELKDSTDYVRNVHVIRNENGVVQRNETAFRHALRVAFKHKQYNRVLTDEIILGEYTRAYQIACEQDQHNRKPELLSEASRKSLARRIRRYVNNPTRPTRRTGAKHPDIDHVTPVERHVLKIFGSRGGTESAKRKWENPESEQAQKVLRGLEKANQKRQAQGNSTRARIYAFVTERYAETGTMPTWKEIGDGVRISRPTVARHMKALKEAGMLPE